MSEQPSPEQAVRRDLFDYEDNATDIGETGCDEGVCFV